MSGKHTKGPWSMEDRSEASSNPPYLAIGVEHREYGFVSHCHVEAGCEEAFELGDMEANAKLIAASPLLYEALEAVEWISSHGFTFCPCCNHTKQAGHALDCALNNAIRVARGEK